MTSRQWALTDEAIDAAVLGGSIKQLVRDVVAVAASEAVAAAVERCAKLAEAEGPCCHGQKCHEAAAARIRNGGGG